MDFEILGTLSSVETIATGSGIRELRRLRRSHGLGRMGTSPSKTLLLPRPTGRQREDLYLPADGHTVVLGTAGSGKTTLAILRSASTDHGGRTLLVTFNRCLVTYMRHLTGAIRRPVVVENYHRFARGYLSSRGKLPDRSICSPQERLRFIRFALHDARGNGGRSSILQRPEEFFDEEFQWIQQHGIADARSYIGADRIGRAMARVTRAERVDLFALYERYLARREQGGKLYDWSDLASAVLGELPSDRTGRRYRHVVIDEGQDFSPEMLRSLAAVIPGEGSLTFFGDIAQQIYGHRMSWRSAGLAAREIWRFKENYRNTKQISRLALALAAMPNFPDDPDLVEPTAPAADGPLPALGHTSDRGSLSLGPQHRAPPRGERRAGGRGCDQRLHGGRPGRLPGTGGRHPGSRDLPLRALDAHPDPHHLAHCRALRGAEGLGDARARLGPCCPHSDEFRTFRGPFRQGAKSYAKRNCGPYGCLNSEFSIPNCSSCHRRNLRATAVSVPRGSSGRGRTPGAAD